MKLATKEKEKAYPYFVFVISAGTLLYGVRFPGVTNTPYSIYGYIKIWKLPFDVPTHDFRQLCLLPNDICQNLCYCMTSLVYDVFIRMIRTTIIDISKFVYGVINVWRHHTHDTDDNFWQPDFDRLSTFG